MFRVLNLVHLQLLRSRLIQRHEVLTHSLSLAHFEPVHLWGFASQAGTADAMALLVPGAPDNLN